VERRRAERAAAPDAPAAGGGPGIEPRNLTERVVAELWKEALELESIGVHDDFFDLGGNSHKAIRLCYRVKEAFDIDFPVSELFEASTVAAMAALLDRQRDRSVEQGPGGGRPSLITLSEIGAREPAYFIPGGTGDENIILFLYGKITHHLGAERPVLAFRAPGLDGRGAPPGRIEALAEAYIEEMRRRQPAGPYYLVGFCIGGLLAFEIARRLRGSGDDVGVLALVDTAFPGIGRVLRNRTRGVVKFVNRNLRFLTRGLWGRAGVHLARVRELGAREAPAYLLSKLYGLGRYYDHATRPAMRLHPDREVARRIGRGQAAYQRSLLAYRAQPYDGEIQVFVSGGERELRGERWRAVARGGLQLHEVPGDHYTHCREFADDLAARLGACLDAGPGGR
jgi:thioesterase domain-containing protein/acyl carrier protein